MSVEHKRKAVSTDENLSSRVGFLLYGPELGSGSYWQLAPIGIGWKARGKRRPRVAFFKNGGPANRRFRERMQELNLIEVAW